MPSFCERQLLAFTEVFHMESAIMDMKVLEKISTATLMDMQVKITEILRARTAIGMRVGSKVWFMDQNGQRRTVMVKQINRKTVSCCELDSLTGAPMHNRVWRVSPSLLNLVVEHEKPKPKAEAAPTSAVEASW